MYNWRGALSVVSCHLNIGQESALEEILLYLCVSRCIYTLHLTLIHIFECTHIFDIIHIYCFLVEFYVIWEISLRFIRKKKNTASPLIPYCDTDAYNKMKTIYINIRITLHNI